MLIYDTKMICIGKQPNKIRQKKNIYSISDRTLVYLIIEEAHKDKGCEGLPSERW